LNLRSELAHLTGTETSWNVSEIQIEDFIDDNLQGEELKTFLAELKENSGLRAEVALRKNIDKSIGEGDVINLRSKLIKAKQDVESNEIRSLIPETPHITHAHWWRAGVAVAVILIAIGGFMGRTHISTPSYESYFEAPHWVPQRSVMSDVGILQQANGHFINGEYDKALVMYDKAIQDKDEKFVFQFYKASALQNLERYKEAIPEYSNVIQHGDNMFVEEAEWFRTLCFLKLGKTEEARNQLLAIVDRNGYYSRHAKAVLRKTRYSFR
jgi:tetratricopeptide (TPR) repeat protein